VAVRVTGVSLGFGTLRGWIRRREGVLPGCVARWSTRACYWGRHKRQTPSSGARTSI
jgi:hypothetical protein